MPGLGTTGGGARRGSLSADKLHGLGDTDEYDAAAFGKDRMDVVWGSVEMVACPEVVLAEANVSLEHVDLFAARMSVSRIAGAGVEPQEDSWGATRRLVEAEDLYCHADDTRLVERLPGNSVGPHELIERGIRPNADLHSSLTSENREMWMPVVPNVWHQRRA
jgi:hypothetical protein